MASLPHEQMQQPQSTTETTVSSPAAAALLTDMSASRKRPLSPSHQTEPPRPPPHPPQPQQPAPALPDAADAASGAAAEKPSDPAQQDAVQASATDALNAATAESASTPAAASGGQDPSALPAPIKNEMAAEAGSGSNTNQNGAQPAAEAAAEANQPDQSGSDNAAASSDAAAGTADANDGSKPTQDGSKSAAESAADSIETQKRKRTRTAEALEKMQFAEGQRETIVQLIEEAKQNKKPGEVIVVNDVRLTHPPAGVSPVFLGHVVYTGAHSRNPHSNRAADLQLFLLPQFTSKHHYATIEIRIPAEFLTYRGNIAVRKSALWGTDVYTDDSDVVAMIIHSGHYRPVDAPDPQPKERSAVAALKAAAAKAKAELGLQESGSGESGDVEMQAIPEENFGAGGMAGPAIEPQTMSHRLAVSPIASPVQPLVAIPDATTSVLFPDHDLHVTLRVLPKLIKYTGSTRYGLDSRGWGGSHDGESLMVERVERVERGSVGRKGRKVFSKKWGEMAKTVTKESDFVYLDGSVVDRRAHSDKGASGFGSDGNDGDVTMLFSENDGVACIKYSPKVMVEWPTHLLNALSDGKDGQTHLSVPATQMRRRSSILTMSTAVGGGSGLSTMTLDLSGIGGFDDSDVRIPRADLDRMRTWPFWRVKLSRCVCVLEGVRGERHELRRTDGDGEAYRLTKMESGRLRTPHSATVGGFGMRLSEVVVFDGVCADALEWTADGLRTVVSGQIVAVAVAKLFWRRQTAVSA